MVTAVIGHHLNRGKIETNWSFSFKSEVHKYESKTDDFAYSLLQLGTQLLLTYQYNRKHNKNLMLVLAMSTN